MNVTTIKKKGQIRGRAVDPAALAEVRELLGEEPRRRDLLCDSITCELCGARALRRP